MKTRFAGLVLIGCGILAAVLFVYLPIRDGPDGFMGRVRLNALVFIPLAVVTGLAFVAGGAPVLEAFQARPKSKGQLALVLSILIGSGVLTGLGYWQPGRAVAAVMNESEARSVRIHAPVRNGIHFTLAWSREVLILTLHPFRGGTQWQRKARPFPKDTIA